MLPTTNTSNSQVPGKTEPVVDVRDETEGASDKLEPIGPERLRRLREAIKNGTYPTEADVIGGLHRMLGIDG